MTNLLDISLQANAEAPTPTTIPTHEASAFSGRRHGLPLFVPREQLYYWTHDWQNGEREALGDLAEGRFHTFPTGREAALWLLGDDQPEPNSTDEG